MYLAFAIFGALLGMSRSTPADKLVRAATEEVRVMPVARTSESNSIILKIAVPKQGELISKNPVWMQFRIDGYSLGSDSSQFQRAGEIAISDMGQTVHVVIDDRPYFPINEPALNPFNEEGYFYTQSYRFKIPFSLKEGAHTIRVFPARSFGESLKADNTYFATYFYVGTSDAKLDVDLSKPYLTYNEPSGIIPLTVDQPVLVDFLISNCELTPDGYQVRLTINGLTNRMITSWHPFYIYGLGKGKHTLRLELFNGTDRVPGPFNDVERTFVIQ